MAMIDGMLQELEQEAKTTRRVLERVPGDQLGWRPHKKARTLGELALHVAGTPGAVATLASQSEVQEPDFKDATPKSAAELIPALDESIATAKRMLGPHGRCDAERNVADEAQRTGGPGDAARRAAAIGHAEPLVSPPRSAVGVSARARRADPVDLRTERRRKSFRVLTLPTGSVAGARGPRLRLPFSFGPHESRYTRR